MSDKRLDLIVSEMENISREQAKRLVSNGFVLVNEKVVKKAGEKVSGSDEIYITEHENYLNQGEIKLLKAFTEFQVDVNSKNCIDIGASTGGFTKVLLDNNAKKVYSVDVGENQLVELLINNPKVIVMDKTNARYLAKDDFPDEISFITIDVSFISILKILPSCFNILIDGGELVALIKPQFEGGIKAVNKSGIVKNKNVHINILKNIVSEVQNIGFNVNCITNSPVKGKKGNVEFLMHLTKMSNAENINLFETSKILSLVEAVHGK